MRFSKHLYVYALQNSIFKKTKKNEKHFSFQRTAQKRFILFEFFENSF